MPTAKYKNINNEKGILVLVVDILKQFSGDSMTDPDTMRKHNALAISWIFENLDLDISLMQKDIKDPNWVTRFIHGTGRGQCANARKIMKDALMDSNKKYNLMKNMGDILIKDRAFEALKDQLNSAPLPDPIKNRFHTIIRDKDSVVSLLIAMLFYGVNGNLSEEDMKALFPNLILSNDEAKKVSTSSSASKEDNVQPFIELNERGIVFDTKINPMQNPLLGKQNYQPDNCEAYSSGNYIEYFSYSDMIKNNYNYSEIWIAWKSLTTEITLSTNHGDIVRKNLENGIKYTYFIPEDASSDEEFGFMRHFGIKSDNPCLEIKRVSCKIPLHGLTVYEPTNPQKRAGYIGHQFYGMSNVGGFRLPDSEVIALMDELQEKKNDKKIEMDIGVQTTGAKGFKTEKDEGNLLHTLLDTIFAGNEDVSYNVCESSNGKKSFEALITRRYNVFHFLPSGKAGDRVLCDGELSFEKSKDGLCMVRYTLNRHTKLTTGPQHYFGIAMLAEPNDPKGTCWIFLKKEGKSSVDFIVLAFRLTGNDVEKELVEEKSLDTRLCIQLSVTSNKGRPTAQRILLVTQKLDIDKHRSHISALLNLYHKDDVLKEEDFEKINSNFVSNEELLDKLNKLMNKTHPYNKISDKADDVAYKMISKLLKDACKIIDARK
jgi:hypothetical protein